MIDDEYDSSSFGYVTQLQQAVIDDEYNSSSLTGVYKIVNDTSFNHYFLLEVEYNRMRMLDLPVHQPQVLTRCLYAIVKQH